jgi:ribose transport system substrate-binding protein
MFTRRTVIGALSAMTILGYGSTMAMAQDKMYIPLISKGFQHQFWQAVKAGADKAAADLGVEVTFEGPDSETQVDRQIDMLAAALAKKPAAIGFAALDSQAAIPLLQQAKDAKIPVVAFDSGVDSDIPVATASTNNIAAAALAADKMAELIGDEGKVALVVHDQTSRTGVDRRDGFVNRMKEATRRSRSSPSNMGRAIISSRPKSPRRSCRPTPTSRACSVPMKARPSASSTAPRSSAASW